MKNLLIKKFIKASEDITDSSVREAYGKLAGAVGIGSNIVICIMKILSGLLFSSISILADGINNLTDASASLVTLLGFKLSSKAPDKDHPYGHGRTEYLAGLIICAMILIIGVDLLKSSLIKCFHPDELDFSWISVIVLLISIMVKLWQSSFNMFIGNKINSNALLATAQDSRNDVISTSAVLLALLVGKISSFNLDGPVGVLVALFILKSGIDLTKDTVGPILGQTPDKELVEKLKEFILSYEGVLGIHDLIIHDYGPGRNFASVHVEVNADGNMMETHDLMDRIEHDVYFHLHLLLTIHMDPLFINDPLTRLVNSQLRAIKAECPYIKEFHDLRVVAGVTHHNLVFDAVLDFDSEYTPAEAKDIIIKKLKEFNPMYEAVITVDREFS